MRASRLWRVPMRWSAARQRGAAPAASVGSFARAILRAAQPSLSSPSRAITSGRPLFFNTKEESHPPPADGALPPTTTATPAPTPSSSSAAAATPETPVHAAAAAATAAEVATKYSQQYTNAYVELERTLMSRIHESNRRRFRLALISTVVFIIWVVAVFGKMIRKALSERTAGLAKETLENESFKVQTEELAVAVVHTVLNDPQVTANAATFLREAAMQPETQQALLRLTVHVLQHEESLAEVAGLLKRLVAQMAKDKETVESLGGLFGAALQEPSVKAAAVALLAELCKDPVVEAAVTQLTLDIIGKEAVGEVRPSVRPFRLVLLPCPALLANHPTPPHTHTGDGQAPLWGVRVHPGRRGGRVPEPRLRGGRYGGRADSARGRRRHLEQRQARAQAWGHSHRRAEHRLSVAGSGQSYALTLLISSYLIMLPRC